MFEYISGLILKNKIILAPIYNPTHQILLNEMNIEDNYFNASKKFVKARFLPPNNDKKTPLEKWEIIIPQDVVPDWYNKDPYKYQNEFRNMAIERAKDTITIFADMVWTPIKSNEIGTYYLLDGILKNTKFDEKNNNYATSMIREELQNSELLKKLKNEFGEQLIPINFDLTAMDGTKDYGVIKNDFLSLLNLDLYRECRTKIPPLGETYWLSTADSSSSTYDNNYVCYIRPTGTVFRKEYYLEKGVRPFFILKK